MPQYRWPNTDMQTEIFYRFSKGIREPGQDLPITGPLSTSIRRLLSISQQAMSDRIDRVVAVFRPGASKYQNSLHVNLNPSDWSLDDQNWSE